MRVYDMIDLLMIALGMDKLDVVLSIAMLLCQKLACNLGQKIIIRNHCLRLTSKWQTCNHTHIM